VKRLDPANSPKMRAEGAHRFSERTSGARMKSDRYPEVSPLATFGARFQRGYERIPELTFTSGA
jgi:hypothetical protein